MSAADFFADYGLTRYEQPSGDQFTGDSLLERVARSYEEAIDQYGKACMETAEAENAYLRLHSLAWAQAVEEGVAATVRDKHCNSQKDVCEARMEWNRAQASEKRWRAKANELENRLTACMAHQRFIREAT